MYFPDILLVDHAKRILVPRRVYPINKEKGSAITFRGIAHEEFAGVLQRNNPLQLHIKQHDR